MRSCWAWLTGGALDLDPLEVELLDGGLEPADDAEPEECETPPIAPSS